MSCGWSCNFYLYLWIWRNTRWWSWACIYFATTHFCQYGCKWSDYRFFVFCRPYFCWHYFSCLYARTTPIHGLLIVFAFLAPKQTFLLSALRMAWVCYCCLVIQQAINETLSFFGKTLFKWFGYISASYMLPLAGVFLCVFVGWILPKSQVYAMCEGYLRTIAFEIWYFVIRFIVPLGILAAMIQSAIKDM